MMIQPKTSKKHRKWLSYGLLKLALLCFGIVVADSFFYPGFLAKYTGIDRFVIGAGFLGVFVGVRFLTGVSLPEEISKILFRYIAPFSSVFALVLHLGNDHLHPNFSFSTFHLHAEPFELVSLFLAVLALIVVSKKIFLEKVHWSLFVIPILLLTQLVFFKWAYESTLFWQLKKEDGLFEYTTALAFFANAGIAGYLARKVWSSKKFSGLKKICATGFFVLVALGNFGIAGEEISWGQRILGIETPEEIAARNTQQELTFHNDVEIIGYVYHAYRILAVYCAFMWIIKLLAKRFLPKNHHLWLDMTMPDWFLAPWFIPTIIYTTGRFWYGYIIVGTWEETTEMILSLGLLFFMISLLLQMKKKYL